MKRASRTLRKLEVVATLVLMVLLQPAGAFARDTNAYGLKLEADQLLKSGQIEQAILLYERVLRKNPYFANAYYNLATAYFLKNDVEKSALNLEAFLKLYPNDAEVLYNLGCLKLRLGTHKEALSYFQRAEGLPCSRLILKKTKEALLFMKDLQSQNHDAQRLIAYLLGDSHRSFTPA